MTTNTERMALAASAFGSFLAEHPDLPVASVSFHVHGPEQEDVQLTVSPLFGDDRESVIAWARELHTVITETDRVGHGTYRNGDAYIETEARGSIAGYRVCVFAHVPVRQFSEVPF